MEIKDMTIEQLEARKAEIPALLDSEDADLDALEAEIRSINEELEKRKAEAAQREEIRKAVAAGAGQVKENFNQEENKMTIEEVRSSKGYVDAFAEYLKNGRDTECRSLLTEIGAGAGNGGVPVPAFVDEIVHTAWENDAILSRVKKVYLKCNLKAAFERSADGAYAHTEGTTAVTEESLTLGIVTMIPKMIKKWITISDEAMAMTGESFVRYIYDELTYQITKKLAELVIGDIVSADTSHTATAVGLPKVSVRPA